ADVRELGLIAKYDNKNSDFVASVLYAKRSSETDNTFYNGEDTTGTNIARGKTAVTVIEPYVSKKWNKFKIQAEASLQSGDYGDVYQAGEESKLSGQAYVVDLKYDLNPNWDIGIIAGQVSGDKGDSGKFEAT